MIRYKVMGLIGEVTPEVLQDSLNRLGEDDWSVVATVDRMIILAKPVYEFQPIGDIPKEVAQEITNLQTLEDLR